MSCWAGIMIPILAAVVFSPGESQQKKKEDRQGGRDQWEEGNKSSCSMLYLMILEEIYLHNF